jgi:hypothetical protein
MQFNVPQFIDVEDKIIGPLSLKQFLLLLGGGMVLVLLWYFFKLWFVLLVGGPIVLAIAASIFIKINGRPLPTVFMAWLNYWLKPKFYIWKK